MSPWPRSLTGQLLMAVAVSLLLVQGLGAVLVYRAQSERVAAIMTSTAAARLIAEERGGAIPARQDGRRTPLRRRMRGMSLEHIGDSPLRAGETRDVASEQRLKEILTDWGLEPAAIVVTHREAANDPYTLNHVRKRGSNFGPPIRQERPGKVMIAGVQLKDATGWSVARVRARRGQMELIGPIILQTLLIYLVIVGAVAVIMRRITRPLAALTNRVERFAERPDAEGQVEPEGPDDICRLISAHNAMESRISALLDEKDVMLGAIGHDLKTPLTALRVRIESVEDETERARMAATIEDIVRSLDDMLSLARVGRPSDPLERSELSALLASVVEEYEDMGEAVAFGDIERVVVNLRPTWLRRALRNLIGNALRYGGGARASLSRENGQAVIRIEDDGPGISEDRIQAMIEPFTRGDPSRNTETGGAGLGLALARAVAEQHGGTLKLVNRLDAFGKTVGLAAIISLPLT